MATKFLFSDIDGTLIHKGCIDLLTVKKIQNFIKAGNEFFLCTGRMDYEVANILDTINVSSAFRISQNGSVITNSNNQILDVVHIPKIVIKDLVDLAVKLQEEKQIHFEVSDATSRYTMYSRPSSFYPDLSGFLITNDNLPQDILTGKIEPTILLLISENEKLLLSLQSSILERYKDLVDVVFTSLTSLEIYGKKASKGIAINKILKQFYTDTNVNDVYVVGDSENDISMLKSFSNSFVMQNAKVNVKKHANYGAYVVGDVIDYIYSQDKNTNLELASDKNLISLKKQLLVNAKPELLNHPLNTTYKIIFQDLDQLASYKNKNPNAVSIFEPVIKQDVTNNTELKAKNLLDKARSFVCSIFKKKLIVNHSYSLLLENAISKCAINIVYLNASINSPYFDELSYLIKVCRLRNPKIIIIAYVSSMLEASKAQEVGVNIISFTVNNINNFTLDKLLQIIKIPLILEVNNLETNNFHILYDPKVLAVKYSSSIKNILTKGQNFLNKNHLILENIKIFDDVK